MDTCIVTGREQPFRGREARVVGDGGPARQRDPRIGARGDLGFGRIVVSKAEAPNFFCKYGRKWTNGAAKRRCDRTHGRRRPWRRPRRG